MIGDANFPLQIKSSSPGYLLDDCYVFQKLYNPHYSGLSMNSNKNVVPGAIYPITANIFYRKIPITMSFYLFIAAAIGLSLFIIAYLVIVLASFRHHPVTGLIALLPGLNLAVLPSVWRKTGKAFLLSIFGLGLSLLAWYSGGNQYLQSRTTLNETIVPQASPSPANSDTPSTSLKQVSLPEKPLYYLVYQEVERSKLTQLAGQQVRLTLIDGQRIEGKQTKSSDQAIFIETSTHGERQTLKVALQHIQHVEMLTQVKN